MEVHYSEYKHMVNQWSVCARQKKGRNGWDSTSSRKQRLLLEVLYSFHMLWHRITRR